MDSPLKPRVTDQETVERLGDGFVKVKEGDKLK